jgi:hypothetical protein
MRKKKRDRAKSPVKMTAVIRPKSRRPYGGGGLIGASTPGPQLDSDVDDSMAILPRSVQRRNVDVLANHMLDSAPDEMGSSTGPSVDVDDAMVQDGGPTDAVFHRIDEAHAPLPSTSPEMCFLLE